MSSVCLALLLFTAEGDTGNVIDAGPSAAPVLDLVGAILILVGSTFTLIAAIGLVRFSDLFSRTHAAAKPQMLGLMLMLAGLVFMQRSWAWFAICTLVVGIQMIAAPVASHLLGRAAYITGLAQSESLVLDELKQGRVKPDSASEN